jgi:hypothetical protein
MANERRRFAYTGRSIQRISYFYKYLIINYLNSFLYKNLYFPIYDLTLVYDTGSSCLIKTKNALSGPCGLTDRALMLPDIFRNWKVIYAAK